MYLKAAQLIKQILQVTAIQYPLRIVYILCVFDDKSMAFLAKWMEMFPHSGCMVEFHDHWMSGSPHVASAASTVEQIEQIYVW